MKLNQQKINDHLKLIYRTDKEKKINVVASHSYDIWIPNPLKGLNIPDSLHIGEFCLLFTGKLVSLWGLEIYEPFRKRGYAKKLLQTVINALAAQGRHILALYVKPENEAAIALYSSLGFKCIQQEDSNSLYYELDLIKITIGNLPHFSGMLEITY